MLNVQRSPGVVGAAMREFLWLITLPTLAFACGDEPVVPCGPYECVMELEALATPAELASTPREDSTAELVALDLSPGLVADSDDYDRVVRDLSSMAKLPTATGVLLRGRHNGKTLLLILKESAASAHEDGLYRAWDNLNTLYGAQRINANRQQPRQVVVSLQGVFDLRLLAQQYVQLPGVVGAIPVPSYPGAGNTPYSNICAWAERDRWRYLAEYHCSDCMAGCGFCRLKLFESTTDGPAYEIELPPSGMRERAEVCFERSYPWRP